MINKSDMLQDIERVLVSEEEIHARIKEVGAQIAEDYRGKCPILVGVLKGVVPFFAEMANAISIPVQEDFMCITSFEGGTESTGKLTFRKDIDHDIEGRHVLILEDIIDSGSTLKMICEMFRERKPASITITTPRLKIVYEDENIMLLDKPTGRKVDLKPDYTCFTVPPAFVVGFGLDYEDYYRNLPFVGVLKPSVYQDQ
jgi:hypoxanthine phosphoribosyltransferase